MSIVDRRLRIVDCPPAAAFAAGGRDCGLGIADWRLPIEDCRLDCRMGIVDWIASRAVALAEAGRFVRSSSNVSFDDPAQFLTASAL
jgi:hypothetical protein